MNTKIIDKAFAFAWSELKNRLATWFVLSLKTLGVLAFMLLGAAFLFILPLTFLSIKVYSLLEHVTSGHILGSFIVVFLFLGSLYFTVYYLLSFGNVPASNALDAVRKTDLRNFKNRVQTHALVGGIFLYYFLVFAGAIFFIIPGIIFAVRFSCVRWILLDEQCGVMEAFSASWKITQGRFGVVCLAKFIDFILSGLAPLSLLNTLFSVRDLFFASVYNQLLKK